MKLKKNAPKGINAWCRESGDFWYDLTLGGYLKPSDYLNPTDAKKVMEAISILEEFESLLPEFSDEENTDE